MRRALAPALILVAGALLAFLALGPGGTSPDGGGVYTSLPAIPRPSGPVTATSPAPAPAGTRETPALKSIWGPNALPDGRSAFPLYRRLGVDVLQAQLNWARVAGRRPARPEDPDDPAYAWPAALDVAVRGTAAHGMELCLMVKETPGWANGERGVAQAPDRDADLAAFLVAASRRYPGVRRWLVWGEPNREGNFAPMPAGSPVGPRRYARLLDAAYAALKRADPSDEVVGGNTWTAGDVGPAAFLRDLRLPDGRPPRLDLYGHNPYAVRFPRLDAPVYDERVRDISDLDALHEQLRATYGAADAPDLWVSEWSVSSDRPNRALATAVSRAEQARWLTAAFALVNAVPYVRGLGWWTLLDEPPDVPGAIFNGLLTADGRPKPVFEAFRRAP